MAKPPILNCPEQKEERRERTPDLTGQKFGRLTVVCFYAYKDGHDPEWSCLCECGRYIRKNKYRLTHGKYISCGCWMEEEMPKVRTTHGMTKTRMYRVWRNMFQRCYNPKSINYHLYGARGVSVCERWETFENFYEDMHSTHSNELTLDRINCDGNYEPSNCKWSTRLHQQNNRRNTIRITSHGQSLTVGEWSKLLGVPIGTISRRKWAGWSDEECLYGRMPNKLN